MESDTTIIGAEKEKLRMELNNKEVALKKEKTEQEAVRQKLEKLESQLLSGTGSVAVQSILNNEANMVDHTNEQQKVLEKRKKEVAERRRAQQAAAQELEQIEDLGKEMEKTYSSLQNEVETKTRKLRKLFTKLQTFKQEIVDVTEEYNRDRRDLEETQQQLLKELKLKMLIRYVLLSIYYIHLRAEWIAQTAFYGVKLLLTIGDVGGARVDPPPRKMDTFFLWSLTLSMSIHRNFQSNGATVR